MKRNGLVVSGLLVGALLLTGFLILRYGTDPSGMATGSKRGAQVQDKIIQQELWEDLSRYESNYLASYAEAFREKPDDPMELLTAFNELAYSVTGPGGLWRKKVPQKYFGCQMNEQLEICQRFLQVESEFRQWDKLQAEISNLETRHQALRFLGEHRQDLKAYMGRYVPESEADSSVQATPFFQDKLAGAL